MCNICVKTASLSRLEASNLYTAGRLHILLAMIYAVVFATILASKLASISLHNTSFIFEELFIPHLIYNVK